MNTNEVINKIVRKVLNETYFNTDSVPGPYKASRTEQLLYDYMNSFPPNTSNFIVPYTKLSPKQKNILASIAECNGSIFQEQVEYVYDRYVKPRTTKDIPLIPDDFLGEFLTGDTAKYVYATQGEGESKAVFGMANAVGEYLNKNRNNINYTHFINHINKILRTKYITAISAQLDNRLDSPKRSDLPLSGTDGSVTFNNAFSDNGENLLQKIINDKNVNLGGQELEVVTAIMNIVGTADPNIFEEMVNLSDTQKVVRLKEYIVNNTSVKTVKDVGTVISKIRDKIKKSEYANQFDLIDVNKIQPEKPQPTPPTPPVNSNPITRISNASKIKTKPYSPTTTSDGNNWTYNLQSLSESRNKNIYNKNKTNMKQKVKISEDTLRRMIVRAINESVNSDSLMRWAIAVKDGKDPIHCREFVGLYNAITSNPIFFDAVKKGFTKESASQGNLEGKTSLAIDAMFSKLKSMPMEVINDFLSGVSQLGDSNKNDSIYAIVKKKRKDENGNETILDEGPCYVLAAKEILGKHDKEFNNLMYKQILTYASHYCRSTYDELMLKWGIGNKAYIENNFSDNDENDSDSMSSKDELSRDPYTGAKKDDKDNPLDSIKDTSANDSAYYSRLINTVEKIVNDYSINMPPQQRLVLQCVADIAKKGVKKERLEAMQGMSDTQKSQEIYNEVSEILGIPPLIVAKRLSKAIRNAKESQYAKNFNESRKRKERFVNEVMNRIMNNIIK